MATSSLSSSSALKQNQLRKTLSYFLKQNRCYSKLNHAKTSSLSSADFEKVADDVPTSGICRPLSEILKELNKKVPDSLVKTRVEKDGFHIRYIPWYFSLTLTLINYFIILIIIFIIRVEYVSIICVLFCFQFCNPFLVLQIWKTFWY